MKSHNSALRHSNSMSLRRKAKSLSLVFLLQHVAMVAANDCSICATTDLYGFGANGVGNCLCTGTGAIRSGPNSCSCSQCYLQQGDKVMGYGYQDGKCPWGSTDCLACQDATPSATPSTTTKAPSPSPSATSQTPSGTTNTASSGSKADGGGNRNPSGNNATSSRDNATSNDAATKKSGMKPWQIILIICSGVLVFVVAMVTILSCYCKARQRLDENEHEDDDASFYHNNYRMDENAVPMQRMTSSSLYKAHPAYMLGGRTSMSGSNLSHPPSTQSVSAYGDHMTQYSSPPPPGAPHRLSRSVSQSVGSDGGTATFMSCGPTSVTTAVDASETEPLHPKEATAVTI